MHKISDTTDATGRTVVLQGTDDEITEFMMFIRYLQSTVRHTGITHPYGRFRIASDKNQVVIMLPPTSPCSGQVPERSPVKS